MKLFGYYRSSAAFRVRIALNLKGMQVDHRFVHLRKGEQSAPEYGALNPQGLVPLVIDGPQVLTQSLAIIEYLEETHPEPALLPKDPIERARVRAIAQAIASDIHPLNNLRVLRYLVGPLKVSDEAKNEWYRHWVVEGLTALERSLTPAAGHRHLLPWRYADAGRCLPGSAGLQRRAGRHRPLAVPADHEDRRRLP